MGVWGEAATGPFLDLRYSSWDSHSGAPWSFCVLMCWSLVEIYSYREVTAAEAGGTAGVSGLGNLYAVSSVMCAVSAGEKTSPV